MNRQQFRDIVGLLCLLLVGQALQTLLLLRAQRLTQRTTESAEVAAIDALEVAKQARQPEESTPATRLLFRREGGTMPKPLSKDDVLALAKQAVTENDTWAERATYAAQKTDDGWAVSVWRIEGYDASGNPQFTLGWNRSIQIDKEGRVTTYIRGY